MAGDDRRIHLGYLALAAQEQALQFERAELGLLDRLEDHWIRKPWKRIGLNSMITLVQLINQPITPVKNGIVTSLIQSLVLKFSASPRRRSWVHPCRDPSAGPGGARQQSLPVGRPGPSHTYRPRPGGGVDCRLRKLDVASG